MQGKDLQLGEYLKLQIVITFNQMKRFAIRGILGKHRNTVKYILQLRLDLVPRNFERKCKGKKKEEKKK